MSESDNHEMPTIEDVTEWFRAAACAGPSAEQMTDNVHWLVMELEKDPAYRLKMDMLTAKLAAWDRRPLWLRVWHWLTSTTFVSWTPRPTREPGA